MLVAKYNGGRDGKVDFGKAHGSRMITVCHGCLITAVLQVLQAGNAAAPVYKVQPSGRDRRPDVSKDAPDSPIPTPSPGAAKKPLPYHFSDPELTLRLCLYFSSMVLTTCISCTPNPSDVRITAPMLPRSYNPWVGGPGSPAHHASRGHRRSQCSSSQHPSGASDPPRQLGQCGQSACLLPRRFFATAAPPPWASALPRAHQSPPQPRRPTFLSIVTARRGARRVSGKIAISRSRRQPSG